MKRTLCCCLLLLSPALFAQSLEDAQSALNQGQYQRALDELDKYLDRKPQDAEARFSKGLALVMLQKDPEAIKVFADLARDFPELPEPYNNLAVLYARAGQYEEARDALESALVTHPSYATAHENLGDIYTALANAAYNRAVVLDKNNQTIRVKLDLLAQLTALQSGGEAAQITAQQPQPSLSAVAAANKPAPVPKRPVNTAPIIPTVAAAPAISAPVPVLRSTEPVDYTASLPTPAAAPNEAQILNALKTWRETWSAQNADAYLATYSPNFDPETGVTREVWESQRRTRVVRPRSINIQALNPKVFQSSATQARVVFLQIYESNTYSDQVRKQLDYELINGKWLIVKESVIS